MPQRRKNYYNIFIIDTLFIWFKKNLIAILLVLVSLWELRNEIRLLIDNFTFIALFYAGLNHPLAVFVLILSPKFKKSY